jgi:branched-chain amino acid transport system ATP-binding protein
MGVVMEISDHIVVLDYGVKISDGDGDFVRSDPKVIAAYLGVDDEEVEHEPEVAALAAEALAEVPAKVAKAARKAGAPKARKPEEKASAKPAAKATEKVASKPATKAAPAAKTKPTPAPKPPAEPDDLTRIKGIGPVNQRKLGEHGVTTFAQVSSWKKADIVAAEAYLEFDGRIAREDWVGQAKKLAKAPKPAAKPKTGKGGAK